MRAWCHECPLRRSGLFKPVTPGQLDAIAETKRDHVALPAGAEIIHAGQQGAELFTLFSGWAFRFKSLPDGRRQILNFLLPGDLVGLQAAMFDASQHGVEALSDVELCLLPRRRVWELFHSHPELAFDVTWLGAREEAMVDDGLMSVGRRSAAERVAALIASLFRRAEALGTAEGGAVPWPLGQQHVADALGLSLVHTNKTLARLRRAGLFERANGRLRVPDLRALERYAHHDPDAGAAPGRPLI